jgi:Fic family protein
VGRHIVVSPGAVPRFLAYFEKTCSGVGKADVILATAAAHHRLLWVHPFLDGNGRVTRLMSHAMLLDGLDTGAVWSMARGLARSDGAYKQHLTQCDLPRRNDLDGRGNPSEEALASFTRFFLETCIDQVNFMESLMQPDRLRTRISLWAEEETRLSKLPPKAGAVVEAILYRGELPRGDVAGRLDLTPRHARRIVSELLSRGVLTSKGPRDPLLLLSPPLSPRAGCQDYFRSTRRMTEEGLSSSMDIETRKAALELVATRMRGEEMALSATAHHFRKLAHVGCRKISLDLPVHTSCTRRPLTY